MRAHPICPALSRIGPLLFQRIVTPIGEVKKIGNGGMIMSSKKYLGRNVHILVRREK